MPDRSPANAAGRPYQRKVSVGTGAAANTNIAVTGIRRGVDYLDQVLYHAKEGALPVDKTSVASITSDGNIQLTDATAEGALEIFWRRRQP